MVYRAIKSEEEFTVLGFADLEMTFTVSSLGEKQVELHRFGRNELVTWANLRQYCDELEAYRLSEMAPAAAAIRRG